MAKLFIIGTGNFGTALAQEFSCDTCPDRNEIIMYSVDKDAINEINTKHRNTRYLPGVRLSKTIRATTSIHDAKDADVIFVVVPSFAVKAVAKDLKPLIKDQLIVSTSKALSPDGEVMTDIIERELCCKSEQVVAFSGPSIAKEVAKGLPTEIQLGGERHATKKLTSLLTAKNLILTHTTDKRGIQLLGFYKNVIALLIGVCDGLKMGNNFKSALVAHAYSEFYHLNIPHHIRRHTFVGAAGLGDLYVTSISKESRNRRFGLMLAAGHSPEGIKEKIGQVVEGYESLLALENLKDKQYLDENLLNMLLSICRIKRTKAEMKELLVRYLSASEIKNVMLDWGNVLTEGIFTQRVADTLGKQYAISARTLFHELEGNEREALLGHEHFKDFHARIKASHPEITYDAFEEAYKSSVTFDKDMLAYCKSLKKRYKLFLLSNNYSIVTPILRKSEIMDIFDGVIFSNEVHEIKPEQEIFEHAIHKFGIKPRNTLFVDDSSKNVHAAEHLGIRTIQFKGKKQLEEYFYRNTF